MIKDNLLCEKCSYTGLSPSLRERHCRKCDNYELDNIKEFCPLAETGEDDIVTCEGGEECPYYEHYRNGFYFDCSLIGG